jgi:hypothetical protein
MYGIGCVAAVLAVQQAGLFTAVIQPPLILFVAVPSAYFVFHGGEFTGLKDTLINYGYPLIERFPLMLFTSAGVLLIGLVRWYFAAGSHSSVPVEDIPAEAPDQQRTNRLGGLATSLRSRFKRSSEADSGEPKADAPTVQDRPRRRHSANRSSTNRSTGRRAAAGRSTGERSTGERRSRTNRSAERKTPTRSRHARPPMSEEPPQRRAPRPPRYENHDRYESPAYRPRHGGSDYNQRRSHDQPRSERPRSRNWDGDYRPDAYEPIPQPRYRAPERSYREPDWRYDR